jgi:8-oxo-dGTP pyrophosphatase MutT (NUDIX family)
MRLKHYLNEEDKEITQKSLDKLEVYADKLFKAVGIDIEFTTHFLKRVNDKRNKKQINMIELMRLFRKSRKIYGKKIVKLGAGAEAVIKDMITDINMPFVLKWDNKSQELDLVAKTIMRKKDFKTSNLKLTLEAKPVKQVSAAVCLTDGTKFLVAHPTGKSFWELPKGLIEPGEKPHVTAARELQEETGVKINAGKLKFFKKFKLHKTKDVILYIYKTDKLPNSSIMSCSTFMKGGKPETDNWMYITFDQIEEYVRPEMQDVLTKIGRLYEV